MTKRPTRPLRSHVLHSAAPLGLALALLGLAACAPSGHTAHTPSGHTDRSDPAPQSAIPPIDLAAPQQIETATFALG